LSSASSKFMYPPACRLARMQGCRGRAHTHRQTVVTVCVGCRKEHMLVRMQGCRDTGRQSQQCSIFKEWCMYGNSSRDGSERGDSSKHDDKCITSSTCFGW
jgi:hypothetical protein